MKISDADKVMYADKIMHMIVDDMISRQVSTEADSFQDLHDDVDANMYMIDAEVPWEGEDVELMNDYVGVQDIVDLRLRAGRPTLVEGLMGGDVASFDWGVTWYTVATDENDGGQVEIDGGELIEAASDSIALVRRMCSLEDLEEGDQFSENSRDFEHFRDYTDGVVTVGAPGTEPTSRKLADSHLFWVIRKDPEN